MSAATEPPELSVIVPTYNERDNLTLLLPALATALQDIDHEIIVVDDNSPDGTWQVADSWPDRRVRVLRRIDDRGLSSAVLTGMQIAQGQAIAVIDADLQHDESVLPALLDEVRAGADLAIGSRRVSDGGFGEWSRGRRVVSWGATQLSRFVVPRNVTDPMSGFFVVSRPYLRQVEADINPRGFKILLELLARGQPTVAEVGYVFRTRQHGETKLSGGVAVEYLLALAQLRLGRAISATFASYALVGITGAIINLLGYVLARLAGVPTEWAVLVGIESSILFNYLANRRLTFSLTAESVGGMIRGFVIYHLMSLYGIFVQFAVFSLLRGWVPFRTLDHGGMVLANGVAIAVASVGNYAVHSNYTWRLLMSRPQSVADAVAADPALATSPDDTTVTAAGHEGSKPRS